MAGKTKNIEKSPSVRSAQSHDDDNDEDDDDDIEQPGATARLPTEKAEDGGVVELIAFHERYRGVRALAVQEIVHGAILFEERAERGGVQLVREHLWHLHFGSDGGMEIHHRSHDDADPHLTHQLELPGQTALALLEDLDVIVDEADGAEPEHTGEQQQDVHVVEPREQQRGYHDTCDDHEAVSYTHLTLPTSDLV